MGLATRDISSVLLLAFACLSSGCGGGGAKPITPDNPMEGVILNDVGELYRSYSVSKGVPPKSLAEIGKLEAMAPAGYEALKNGKVLVNWDAKLPDTGEEPGKVAAPEVLAYEKDVPEKGGYVLLLDRTIKKMTADEFKAAPKAGK